MTQFQKGLWWAVTAVFAIAGFTWNLVGEPGWWAQVVPIAVIIISAVVGKPWQPPDKP